MCDYVCSRPLCALLPRYPALRTVALSGYSIDVDLAPLNELPELEAFSLDTDQLPPLGGLPPQLRRLSLSCIANTARWATRSSMQHALGGLCTSSMSRPSFSTVPDNRSPPLSPAAFRRVSVPQQLRRLESLACHCPHQRVFLGLGRALEQCRSIRATGSAVHLLLQASLRSLCSLRGGCARPRAGRSCLLPVLRCHRAASMRSSCRPCFPLVCFALPTNLPTKSLRPNARWMTQPSWQPNRRRRWSRLSSSTRVPSACCWRRQRGSWRCGCAPAGGSPEMPGVRSSGGARWTLTPCARGPLPRASAPA